MRARLNLLHLFLESLRITSNADELSELSSGATCSYTAAYLVSWSHSHRSTAEQRCSARLSLFIMRINGRTVGALLAGRMLRLL